MSQQAVGRALAHAALIRADGSFIMNAQTRSDFDMPEPPAEAVRRLPARPAGADRAAHPQHRRRDRQAARDPGRLSLHDPAGRPGSDQGAPDRHGQHRRISRARGQPPHHADRLRAALSRPDAGHRAVGHLDRHRGRRPAGQADPPAYRRRRRGGDRQSRRRRAGAAVRRRRRLAGRHVQQDAAAVEVAAQRDPRTPRIWSTSGGASRKRCSPASRPASSASIPTARSPSSTARPRPCSRFRPISPSARTCRRCCRMSAASSRSAASLAALSTASR